jgi:hypothetical protein
MPLRGVLNPLNGLVVGLEEAPGYFEKQGLYPAEVTLACIRGEMGDPRRKGISLSPSSIDPYSTCRRALFIRRFFDYVIEIGKRWTPIAGTVLHRGLMEEGGVAGWIYEKTFPGEEHLKLASVTVIEQKEGYFTVDLWDGVPFSTRVDRLGVLTGENNNWHSNNWKFQRYSKKPHPLKPEWVLQSNLERLILKKLGEPVPEKMYVWRIIQGGYDEEKLFSRFELPVMEEEEVRGLVENRGKELIDWYRRGEVEKPRKVLEGIPPEGRHQWGGGDKRCGWCEVKEICFQELGLPVF